MIFGIRSNLSVHCTKRWQVQLEDDCPVPGWFDLALGISYTEPDYQVANALK
jgi:hypothetical protein